EVAVPCRVVPRPSDAWIARAQGGGVPAHHSHTPQVRAQDTGAAPFRIEPQCLAFALGDGWKADVHDVDADVAQRLRQLILGPRRDRNAWHLLAIAKGVVVDADLLGRRKSQVVLETRRRPDQLGQRLLQLHTALQYSARPSRRSMPPPAPPRHRAGLAGTPDEGAWGARWSADPPGAFAPMAPGRPFSSDQS